MPRATRETWKIGTATAFRDDRGVLAPMELAGLISHPARFFWIRNVPPGARRAGHAHRSSSELVIVLSGSVDAVLREPGGQPHREHMTEDQWLLIPPGHFVTLERFTAGTVLGVLATGPYDTDEIETSD